MRVVVADTGPLYYLMLIRHIGLLPELFGTVTVPATVHAELRHPSAPEPVRRWAASPPAWLTVAPNPQRPDPQHDDPVPGRLDRGERATIELALLLGANLVLMDDRAGVAAARAKGLTVIGTVGVLGLGAERRRVDIVEAVTRLKATNFRYRPALLNDLLARHRPESDEL